MKIIDPVCGMTVTESSDFHLHHKAKNVYFCSSGCLDKFKGDPEKYLNPKAEDQTTCFDGSCSNSVETYTCPMHPDVEKQGNGTCPKCGVALAPKGWPVDDNRIEYTGRMHPELGQ